MSNLNNSIGFLIGLGLGLGIAAGVRPFLPALLAGGLAAAKVLGMRFVPGDYSFLQADWWLIAVAVALALAYLLQFRIGSVLFDNAAPAAALAGIGIAVGALLFAGNLCGHGDLAWPGLIGGGLAALLSQATVRPLTARVRARLSDKAAREAVTLYLDAIAVLIAALTALLHPLGYVAVLLFAWLWLAGRRRSSGRYAGLRILGR